jgi:PPOX class probable F420-dependent enzyme
MNAQARYKQTYFDKVSTERGPFAAFIKQRAALLTSYRRDGRAVGTPVNIAVEGEHAYVRTYQRSGKVKRIRRNPEVEIAPCTIAGKVTGSPMHARARFLEGDEAKHAAQLIQHKHRIVQGILVPLAHKLQRHTTVHLELTAA